MSATITRRVITGILWLLASVTAAACGLLDASDPTAVEEAELANASGADMMRRQALSRLYRAVGVGSVFSGLAADEFFSDPRPLKLQRGDIPDDMRVDQRVSFEVQSDLLGVGGVYSDLVSTRYSASNAIDQLQLYGLAGSKHAYIGQMLTVRGYATLQLAEFVCPGFPLNQAVDGRIHLGSPLPTHEVFEHALADFDSALVYGADSARIVDAARVGRARTLIGLGRFAEAAETVALVPTAYVWPMEFVAAAGRINPVWFRRTSINDRVSVADREGATGLDFVSASDPRVRTTLLGPAYDGVTQIRAVAKYPAADSPILLASGVEARLIEAEAALRTGQPQWLTILNVLRSETGNVAGLAPLEDPGTDAARVDLLFRERAFWLFATGHRLGDLRRLVQHYERAPEAVFPTGGYRLGSSYGSGTSIPFPIVSEAAHNPAVTGCTSQ